MADSMIQFTPANADLASAVLQFLFDVRPRCNAFRIHVEKLVPRTAAGDFDLSDRSDRSDVARLWKDVLDTIDLVPKEWPEVFVAIDCAGVVERISRADPDPNSIFAGRHPMPPTVRGIMQNLRQLFPGGLGSSMLIASTQIDRLCDLSDLLASEERCFTERWRPIRTALSLASERRNRDMACSDEARSQRDIGALDRRLLEDAGAAIAELSDKIRRYASIVATFKGYANVCCNIADDLECLVRFVSWRLSIPFVGKHGSPTERIDAMQAWLSEIGQGSGPKERSGGQPLPSYLPSDTDVSGLLRSKLADNDLVAFGKLLKTIIAIGKAKENPISETHLRSVLRKHGVRPVRRGYYKATAAIDAYAAELKAGDAAVGETANSRKLPQTSALNRTEPQ